MNNEAIFPCKIILVGDSNVGKTSIISQYLNCYKGMEKTTVGASYSSKIEKIDNNTISFEIWDTAGQERFRSVNTLFYKETYICILVYDITNEESFKNIKDYWYNVVKENTSNELIFGVAGNKIDLYEQETVDQKIVNEYCDSIGATFHTTSAKANTNIKEIFKDLCKKFIDSDLFKSLYSNKINPIDTKKLDVTEKKNKKMLLEIII